MKRRMSSQAREACEAIARPIVALYVQRSVEQGDLRRSAQSMMRLVQEILQRGCMVRFSPTDHVRLSPWQQWLVSLEWVFQELDREIGEAARYVLVFRLSRAVKTEFSSFGRIASDVTVLFQRTGRAAVTVAEAEAIYRTALVRFVELLDERKIGKGAPEDGPRDQRVPRLPDNVERDLIAAGQRLQQFAQRVQRRQQRRRGDLSSTVIKYDAATAAELWQKSRADGDDASAVIASRKSA